MLAASTLFVLHNPHLNIRIHISFVYNYRIGNRKIVIRQHLPSFFLLCDTIFNIHMHNGIVYLKIDRKKKQLEIINSTALRADASELISNCWKCNYYTDSLHHHSPLNIIDSRRSKKLNFDMIIIVLKSIQFTFMVFMVHGLEPHINSMSSMHAQCPHIDCIPSLFTKRMNYY